jgi:hypothetical protein
MIIQVFIAEEKAQIVINPGRRLHYDLPLPVALQLAAILVCGAHLGRPVGSNRFSARQVDLALSGLQV